jgi:hypothetical protein
VTEVLLRAVSGAAVRPYLPALARLRIEVFREFPYLYDGDTAYEERYLRAYVDSPESLVLLALDGDTVVGASTGIPLDHETEDFRRPFRAAGITPADVFYCGESVLARDYRGRGLYKKFFMGREGHARALGRFTQTAFCAVQRPPEHPRRPAGYVPLDDVWARFGYTRRPELSTTFDWKDLDETVPSPKPMVFWTKPL